MAYRRLLCAVVFCVLFTTTLSIQCYMGVDSQCMFGPDVTDCGEGETCQCTKYRFQCRKNDQACTAKEQLAGIKKWAYTTVAKSTCEQMHQLSYFYSDLTCCSKNKCNQPDHVKCSSFQARRRAVSDRE